MRTYSLRIYKPILLLISLTLAACSQKPVAVTPSVSPSLLPTPSPIAILSPSLSPSPQLQTYRHKDSLFEISFPKGYKFKPTSSGVAFVSADQKFAGAVDYGSAEGKQLNNQQLEASLKAEFTNRLKEVNWQTAKVQPDGSLRLDWTGKDKTGNALDAVSLVEQRGNYIYVLNLFGIDKPYQTYNSDAETIVNSYQIQPQTKPAVSPSPVQSPSSPPQPSPSVPAKPTP